MLSENDNLAELEKNIRIGGRMESGSDHLVLLQVYGHVQNQSLIPLARWYAQGRKPRAE